MSEKNENLNNQSSSNEQYDLNDDRRVKVLSPGALVRKRFFRNRVAVVGLVILIFMFIFSFIGGMISPYEEDQLFYRTESQNKLYAAVTENNEYRYNANTDDFSSIIQAQAMLAITKDSDTFDYRGTTYSLTKEGNDFYSVSLNGNMIGVAYKDIVSAMESDFSIDFGFVYNALKAYTAEATTITSQTGPSNSETSVGTTSFEYGGVTYTIDEEGNILDGSDAVAYISRYVVQAASTDVFLTKDFKDQLLEAIETNDDAFYFTDSDGTEYEYVLSYNADTVTWNVNQEKDTYVFDTYSYPSKEHWLGTDKNGMDMLTRLMYGGRVSLVIGFIVEIIACTLGVLLGGIAGYFGKWVDNLIMRIVDIFYCIPSMPIIIILGAAMDAMKVDPQIRMIYLMLILGFLSWPGIARLVRGQILSLREQEFMTATEATGLSVKRRIFQHLVPNVIPQLIVSATMGLGSTIITEATLSFLGLGVKFPFASWGNIINDVNNTFVLTNYWFIWIPAGVLLLLTVLAFNLVGDGLRDAFDPRMKR